MIQWTSNTQFVAPVSAVGPTVTPSGTAWVNSAVVQLLASVSAASLLTGVVVCTGGVADARFEVDALTGAAGLETPIATFAGELRDAVNDCGTGEMVLPVPIDNIASSARLSVRMRKAGTSTSTWSFALTYLKKPITGNLTTTTTKLNVLPSLAAFTSLPGGTGAWANQAYAQMSASIGTDAVIAAIGVPRSFNGQDFEVDIAKGASGSETVITTIRGTCTLGDGPHFVPLRHPVAGIVSGNRIAARWRTATNAGSSTGLFGVCYYEGIL